MFFMAEPGYTFFRKYVNNSTLSKKLADEYEYIPISKDLIESTTMFIHQKWTRVSNRKEVPNEFLFQGNFFRRNSSLTKPDMEFHSEIEEDLAKLVKDLGLPDK
jgi:hypothetical protein